MCHGFAVMCHDFPELLLFRFPTGQLDIILLELVTSSSTTQGDFQDQACMVWLDQIPPASLI